ncbi:MAG: thioredoxin-disulfide reductase [Clostridia bacterium]|nr:thioredoxin-disulfide reductase [Clostridia bacterium]
MLYDVLIIGGGPAGMTAAIYSKRAGKSILLIERMAPGGQVASTSEIDNYPGIKKTDGVTLANMMAEHVASFGIDFIYTDALDFDFTGKIKKVRTHDGTFEGKSVILCLGASAKQLNLENEKKLYGKGVSYCATCDGNFFKGKTVAVVGGGNSSLEDTLYLTGLAKKIYLIHRRDQFRGEKILVDRLHIAEKKPNSPIEIVLNSQVVKLDDTDKLTEITIENFVTKEIKKLQVDGLFIAIGRKPDTDLLQGKIELDTNGYIIANDKMETSQPGVFAAGDVRQKQLRQIVTACGDGAIAAVNANEYIFKNF